MSTLLSVNINKIATLRNSRGKNLPDVREVGARILDFGAHGLTVHPRPDERHIKYSDLEPLKNLCLEFSQKRSRPTEFNIEGYPNSSYLDQIAKLLPDQATLVPDPPNALTSNAGWNLISEEESLCKWVVTLKDLQVRSSLFVDPATFDKKALASLSRIRPDRIELYTEAFAEAHYSAIQNPNRQTLDHLKSTLGTYHEVAASAAKIGVGVNAGHDLNQQNLGSLLEGVRNISEVSIGHALICEALWEGLPVTIEKYLKILRVANASKNS